MNYKVGQNLEVIETGETVVIEHFHDDVNPIGEIVVCFSLTTIPKNPEQKINHYYITQSTLEKYFKSIEN